MSLPNLPQIVLKPQRAQPFYSGHPWVFAGAIAEIPDGLEVGDEVLLVSREGKGIARGLYNAESQIRVRLYSWNIDQPLDEQFWKDRIRAAVALRRQLFPDENSFRACRMVFSEADGLSGLVVDRFGDWLSVQMTSQALATRKDIFVKELDDQLDPLGIYLRTEKGMTAAEGLILQDGSLLGDPPPSPLFIVENDIDYNINLQEGQKTGFYYDQRNNRRAAARYLQGDILDVCCYTGGFTFNALKHGRATHVTGVDSSAAALQLAEENARLNELSDRCEFVEADSLKYLTSGNKTYDGIILDPPKFARSRRGIDRALKAYFKWNVAALRRLNPGGILVTCSCSGLVSHDEFLDTLRSAAVESGRFLRILEDRGQAPDHPVNVFCPESAYLKCLICVVE
ncbi:class I SAM-dependent rRNA methyltransferase [Rubinisphaera margarita]|uniref:class I SAM-dependent rRNA methyltransferase n=1 Tax=Rubinisphaera margarita TaxID=2909586 RepID=UPI001EE84C86|nr:class I SAM-dependent rRNA methyltransferase [Rubinisphaera margarita]MCG6155031.1 class I SAM-dependent rRNA methyltransferase [Rubinisphaera margarita]